MKASARNQPPKRLQAVVRLAQSHGWSYGRTARGHLRLCPPADVGADAVVFSSTPSDGRGDKNSIARLRRAGVPVPHR